MTDKSEILFWLDREKFYEVGRVLKKNWYSSDLGEVSFSVKAGRLIILSKRGGAEIPCEGRGEISATLTAAKFRSLVTARPHDRKYTGKMRLVFRPEFGEVATDGAGVKATFDLPAQTTVDKSTMPVDMNGSVWPHGFKQVTPENWLVPDREKYDPNITPEHWIELMLESKMCESIPPEISSMYEVARGAIIQAWFFYPLLALGCEQLYRVQETAARVRCEQLSLIPPKIIEKGSRKGQLQQRTFAELILALAGHGHISQEDATRWEASRGLRNMSSHPKRQSLRCHNQAANGLRVAAELINKLFETKKSEP